MSFILDALKKSESDRQRQSSPALYQVRVANPRMGGLPPWAIAVVGLLGVNLVVVTWMLLHHGRQAPAPQTPPPTAVQTPQYRLPAPAPVAMAQAGAPAQTGLQQPPQQAMTMPQQGMPQQQMPQRMYSQPGYPQPAYAQSRYAQPRYAQPNGSQPGYAPQGAPSMGPRMAMGQPPEQTSPQGAVSPMSGNSAPEADATSPSQGQGNPDDYAPAIDPNNGGLGGYVRRGTASGLPLYPDSDAAPSAGLPALRLDFHVYDPDPRLRFVMINMQKLREGDEMPDGIRVDSITPDGAVISHGSAKYFLPRP